MRPWTMFPFLGICIIICSVASSNLVQREAQISSIPILPASLILPSAIASTLLLEDALSSASVSILPPSPFNVSSNAINRLNTTATQLNCDRDSGIGLTVASCVQAQTLLISWLNGLPRSKITIGEQSYGVYDVYDRVRFVSSDRVCAFDIEVIAQEDRVTKYDLSYAANALMRECVTMAGGIQAGSVSHIGLEAKVDMDVQYGRPLPNLQCLVPPPTGPPPTSCFNLLKSMPKSTNEQSFGRIGADVDVVLPYILVREDGRCTLTIDTTGPEDGLVWEVIYTAATEIEATCVRQGRHGLISELGVDGHLSVMLSDSGQPPPGLVTNSSGFVQAARS